MDEKTKKEITIVKEVCSNIYSGKCYLVGGAVIDLIQGNEIKDWDIEVYNVSFYDMNYYLVNAGYKVDLVGKSFGIIKVNVDGVDIDLSIPRRDNSVGIGHADFEIEIDPTMSLFEACIRRDFTINSMMVNVLYLDDFSTSNVIDYFNGFNDLSDGRLSHTNSKTFKEDPLRVLRGMQLYARKCKSYSDLTVELCKDMYGTFDSLPKERVFAEFEKLLMKAKYPSKGLDFLVDCGWVGHFPELKNLIGCKQNPKWHPEGDVWNHTCNVIDLAANHKELLPEDWQLPFMFGALLHDVGKPVTLDEDLSCNGHEKAGFEIARTFMERITNDKELTERVLSIVKNHMRCNRIHRDGGKKSSWKRLHNDLRLDVSAAMARCDTWSKTCFRGCIKPGMVHEPSDVAMEYFVEFGEKKIEPILTGRHLIALGMKPGPMMGEVLKVAYDLQIENGIETVEELVRHVYSSSNI